MRALKQTPFISLLLLTERSKKIVPKGSGSNSLHFSYCFLLRVMRKSLLGPPDPPSSLFLSLSY